MMSVEVRSSDQFEGAFRAAANGGVGALLVFDDPILFFNTKVTELRGGADEIQREAEAVRDEIRDALSDVEDALRGSNHEPAAPPS